MFTTDLVASKLNQQAEDVLTLALVAAGVALIVLGLSHTNKWIKAMTLAWIALP